MDEIKYLDRNNNKRIDAAELEGDAVALAGLDYTGDGVVDAADFDEFHSLYSRYVSGYLGDAMGQLAPAPKQRAVESVRMLASAQRATTTETTRLGSLREPIAGAGIALDLVRIDVADSITLAKVGGFGAAILGALGLLLENAALLGLGLLSSVVFVIGALAWLYNRWVAQPNAEKKLAELQAQAVTPPVDVIKAWRAAGRASDPALLRGLMQPKTER